MNSRTAKRVTFIVSMAVLAAFVLSLLWRIPYIYTLTGFSGWIFLGHLITADDDAPGGFSNPDGSTAFPLAELAIKGLVFMGLLGLIFFVPSVTHIGGTPWLDWP